MNNEEELEGTFEEDIATGVEEIERGDSSEFVLWNTAHVKDAKTGAGKRRLGLLPVDGLRAIIDTFESGNVDVPWRKAYPVDSWRRHGGDIKGAIRKYYNALQRHSLDIQMYLETGDEKYLFTEDTGCQTAGAIGFAGIAIASFVAELTGKYPSREGKQEIDNMSEGKPAYE